MSKHTEASKYDDERRQHSDREREIISELFFQIELLHSFSFSEFLNPAFFHIYKYIFPTYSSHIHDYMSTTLSTPLSFIVYSWEKIVLSWVVLGIEQFSSIFHLDEWQEGFPMRGAFSFYASKINPKNLLPSPYRFSSRIYKISQDNKFHLVRIEKGVGGHGISPHKYTTESVVKGANTRS